MEKTCEACGQPFKKRPRDSEQQWSDRAFCSIPCANVMKKAMPTHLYFWFYAEKRGPDKCWPWRGVCDQHGYGRVLFMTSVFKAHRVSWEMANGPIPDGLIVRHKCDNTNCVNPNHLQTGTQKENMLDASSRGRLNPKSLLNLRPGEKGFYGAGSKPKGGIDVRQCK